MLKIFKTLLLALIPATLVAVYSYREKAILLILVGVVSAVASEALFQWVFKRKYTYKDGGAVVTGLLLALSVSPSTPLVLLAGAAAVAIILGKQVYEDFQRTSLILHSLVDCLLCTCFQLPCNHGYHQWIWFQLQLHYVY